MLTPIIYTVLALAFILIVWLQWYSIQKLTKENNKLRLENKALLEKPNEI